MSLGESIICCSWRGALNRTSFFPYIFFKPDTHVRSFGKDNNRKRNCIAIDRVFNVVLGAASAEGVKVEQKGGGFCRVPRVSIVIKK